MLSVVSLFSGAGGLDLGFKEEGFELIYAVDDDLAAVDCYRRNLGDHIRAHNVSSDPFHEDVGRIARCDVVLGGFPCQGFSKAGPKRRGDSRNMLYVELRRTVAALTPMMFIAENVDGIAQNFGGAYIRKIDADFHAIGYRVTSRLLNAVAYGVPQYRRRIFFVGMRNDLAIKFRWPTPTHRFEERNGEFRTADSMPDQATLFEGRGSSWPLPAARTLRDAIWDLRHLDTAIPDHEVTANWPAEYAFVMRKIGPGQKLCNVRHADTSVKTWHIPEVFGAITGRQGLILDTISRHRRHKQYGDIPNGNPLSVDQIERLAGIRGIDLDLETLETKGYIKAKNGGYDLKGAMFCSGMFKRPRWEDSAPTVLTNFHNPRYFLHPSDDRPFSLRECARLQGFHDTFRITDGSKAVRLEDGYRLVGNAVPPPLARHMAAAVGEALCSAARRNVA